MSDNLSQLFVSFKALCLLKDREGECLTFTTQHPPSKWNHITMFSSAMALLLMKVLCTLSAGVHIHAASFAKKQLFDIQRNELSNTLFYAII